MRSRDPHDMDRPDEVYYGLYQGVVVDNADPENVGRLRVRIPGFIEPRSNWAFPIGQPGSGSADRGSFNVPDVGAEVMVQFLMGDVDHPCWMPGPWGRNEVPAPAKTAGAEAHKVKVIETESYRVVIDDRTSTKTLTLLDKAGGDTISMDGRTRAITVKSTSKLTLESTGLVEINGAAVLVNGVPAGTGRL